MKICRTDYDFKFIVRKSGSDCRVAPDGIYSLASIVPADLCPFAYYSLIPYWLSFRQGAWFRWRMNKDDVICQCPAPDGAVFLVKREKDTSGKIVVKAQVVSAGKCLQKYASGRVFVIGNDTLCPGYFASLWVRADDLETAVSGDRIALDCQACGQACEIEKK